MANKKNVPEKKTPEEKIIADEKLAIDDSFEKVAGVDPSLQFKPLGDSVQGQDSRLLDVVEGMMSTKEMEVRSVLEAKHEMALVKIAMFSEKYKSQLATYLYELLLQLRVSHNGQGRKDMVAAMKAALTGSEKSEGSEDERRRRFFR